MKIAITESQLKWIIRENNLDELDHSGYVNRDDLQILRDTINKNKMVSVAYVLKNGEVRHMLVRKNISSYIPSEREKSEKQLNVQENNDMIKVVDMNAYKRKLRDTGDKSIAAAGSWRTVNLKTVLGFMAGGRFIDLRDENEIMEKFGPEIYGKLTKSMINSMNQEADVILDEPQDNIPQGDEQQEFNEGKSDIYHDTYTSAINAALEYAKSKGYTYDEDETFTEIGMGPKKPSEGKTNRFSITLFKDGKEQKKSLHIQVYGMKSTYELNVYIS